MSWFAITSPRVAAEGRRAGHARAEHLGAGVAGAAQEVPGLEAHVTVAGVVGVGLATHLHQARRAAEALPRAVEAAEVRALPHPDGDAAVVPLEPVLEGVAEHREGRAPERGARGVQQVRLRIFRHRSPPFGEV